MTLDLQTYCVCRIALAQMMLSHPGEQKYRIAYESLRQSLLDENEAAVLQRIERVSHAIEEKQQAGL